MFKIYFIFACIFSFTIERANAQQNYWQFILEASIPLIGASERVIVPDTYATSMLNLAAYKTHFAAAPLEFMLTAAAPLLVELPMPNKRMAKFKVWESPVMAPELAAQLPGVKTYTGQGIDDPAATVKIDFTYNGFHAMILSPDGDVFIDPYYKKSFDHYLSYYRKSFNPTNKLRNICEGIITPSVPTIPNGIEAGNGTQLRTYRLAVACTGEYATFHGGTSTLAASAIATTINRVNGVYEREAAVRMVLVANNNILVFTNAATDPFTNNNGLTLINQSQTVIDANIGNANYDIGHTLSTGAGGLAGLGVVCRVGQKARGVTGTFAPVGDPYDIDYVAHEIGHQFGGNHSFNGNIGNCGGGNRNNSTAYEVGSGTTIMAYAGICGSQDVQANSDAYFHTISYDEIVAYTNTGSGNNCPAITSNGNIFPTVSAGTGGFTIPKNTFFTLTGSATDANGDALTYCWEQFNLGTQGINTATSISGPNFRSYSPVSSPTRTFPRLSDIINNTSTFREVLYNGSTDRTFNFRLTVRDNRTGGGGVQNEALSFVTSGTAGPFTLTTPNGGGIFVGNSAQTVTWNVVSSNLAPISCANVRITLSTDGGLTYPTVILASTNNDGTQAIVMPNVSTSTARMRVECVFANYSFFDISDVNFTINAIVPVTLLNFTARIQKEKVITQWQTAQEVNSSHFVVQRSANGTDFFAVGEVSASGNSTTIRSYFFNDNNPLGGISFYRLKMIDRDGSYKYSNVVTVKFTPVFDLQLSPNPANSKVNITGKMLSGTTILQVFNINGQLVFTKIYSNAIRVNDFLPVDNFASGIYRVKITNGENTMNKKLLIVH